MLYKELPGVYTVHFSATWTATTYLSIGRWVSLYTEWETITIFLEANGHSTQAQPENNDLWAITTSISSMHLSYNQSFITQDQTKILRWSYQDLNLISVYVLPHNPRSTQNQTR